MTGTNTTPYFEVRDLTKIYASADGPVRALDRVSFAQNKGEFVSLVGPPDAARAR